MTTNFKRKPLIFDSFPNVIKDMIEESSEAALVLDKLIDYKGENNSLSCLILLDDMNIRGIQIYNLYKLCHEDINRFYEKVISMSEDDIYNINKSSASLCIYKAVFDGSHTDRLANPSKYLFTDEERENLVNNKDNKDDDLYPTISVTSALNLIENKGFICGFEKSYVNNEHEREVYRVFYNKYNDIIYTHSLDDKDIFLWGASKLNVVRYNNDSKESPCNAYFNVSDVIGYNIELKENPFKTYEKILEKNNNYLKTIKPYYYDNNLIPIIETARGNKYKQQFPEYKSCVMASIYDLLNFKNTYKQLDEGLKKIYAPLLKYADIKAYDEIISHLNSDEGIEIATDLQNILGVSLEKEKLLEAKDRFCLSHGHKIDKCENKFLSKLMTDNSWGREISTRIVEILKHDIDPISVSE